MNMTDRIYKDLDEDERGIHRDMDAVHSYMTDLHDTEEFDRIYIDLCEYYEVTGPGQIPHQQHNQ